MHCLISCILISDVYHHINRTNHKNILIDVRKKYVLTTYLEPRHKYENNIKTENSKPRIPENDNVKVNIMFWVLLK